MPYSIERVGKGVALVLSGAFFGGTVAYWLKRRPRQAEPEDYSLIRQNSVPRQSKSWSPLKYDKAGVITDLTLECSLPYNMAVGGGTDDSVAVSTCTLHRSIQITDIVHEKLKTQRVSGIPGIYFGDLINIVSIHYLRIFESGKAQQFPLNFIHH